MENFEQKLKRLEELSNSIRRSDISLEEALQNFEEGIKLSKGMQEELNTIEGKIQILMREPVENESEKKVEPEPNKYSDDGLELFNTEQILNGTRNS